MSTALGALAENIAADYIGGLGYEVVERNWKTQYCEVDIIARKDKRYYFIEVKYRKSDSWGSGFDYITIKKQKQMARAAESWSSLNSNTDEIVLGAISLIGWPPTVENYLVLDI